MNDYVTCEAAAQQFSLGSDILTKQVRLAASSGEQSHIDAYFEEADTTQNREKALKELERLDSETGATAALAARRFPIRSSLWKRNTIPCA